ncbi:MAG: FtsQ-type POTRA domain-containing protein [Pseudomonadota bacterium]
MARTRSSARVVTRGRRLGRARVRLLGLLVLASGGVGAGYLGVQVRHALQRGELLAIETIQVEGARLVKRSELLGYAGVDVGTGLYAFDLDRATRAIQEHPLVASARLVRRPPHELRLFVVEQKPVAYVALEHLYAMNSSGQLFARAEVLGGLDLPVIVGVDAASMDRDEVPAPLRTALQVLAAWDRSGLKRSELATLRADPALGVDLQLMGPLRHVHLGVQRFETKLGQLVRLRAELDRRGVQASEVFMTDGPDPRRVVVRSAAVPVATGTVEKPT